VQYDLIVVGGGPAGLMAAKQAATDGLKTLLLECKRDPAEINRACSQIFYTRKLSPSGELGEGTGKVKSDGYIDPVSVEARQEGTRFHFHKPGFFIDYTGPLRPYLNWIHVSPGGHTVRRYPPNERPWGFYFHKETFVRELLDAATKAGAEVWTESTGLAAENVPHGVRITAETRAGQTNIEAKAAIAADGLSSRIVESLGLNQARGPRMPRQSSFVQYIMEGIDTGFTDAACSWLTWTIPSLNSTGFIAIGLSDENRNKLGTLTVGNVPPKLVLGRFMSDPRWAPMFRRARIVKTEGMGRSTGFMAPVRNPVSGNVLVAGDAGAIAETWVQGAVACGYQAVKAIQKEFDGKGGFLDYAAWWRQAFAFNTPDYIKMVSQLYPLPKICTDEDIDYLWSIFETRTGIPQLMVAGSLGQIQRERPELYSKLLKVAPRQ